jgi:hypothetical protein
MKKLVYLFIAYLTIFLTLAPATVSAQSPQKTLSLLFYLDNQNSDDVDTYVTDSLSTIEALAGAFSNLPINWITISRKSNGTALKDQRLVIERHGSGQSSILGTLDSALFSDSASLKKFLTAGYSLKADHTVLFMVDHGLGDRGIMTTEIIEAGRPKVSAMSNTAMAQAIVSASAEANRKLDLVVLDACLMGSIEAVLDYTLAGLTLPIVVSENVTKPRSGGLGYQKVLKALLAIYHKDGFDALRWGQAVVANTRKNVNVNFSLIDLNAVKSSGIATAIGEFAIALQANYSKDTKGQNRFKKLFDYAGIEGPSPGFESLTIDFLYLAKRALVIYKADPKVVTAAKKIVQGLTSSILATENDFPSTLENGLSIRYMVGAITPQAREEKLKIYSSLAFSQETGWNKIVKLYTNLISLEPN